MNSLARFLLALAVLVAAAPVQAALPPELRVCGDVLEFPPFVYFERVDGKKTSTVRGYDVDVLNLIVAGSGRKLQIDMLPWARCLLLGARGKYDILLDGIRVPERERDFLLAESHYAVTPLFLYLKDRPRPPIDSLDSLKQVRVCSQADYNYSTFGLTDAMISNRARSVDDAATMLKLDRCNVLLQELEILRANARLGGIDLLNDPTLVQERPAWLGSLEFHYLVSRAVPYRRELLQLLDRGVARLRKSGELERVRNLHHQ